MLLPPAEMPVSDNPVPPQEASNTYFMDPKSAEHITRLEYRHKALTNLASELKAEGSQVNAAAGIKDVEDFEDEKILLVQRKEKSATSKDRLQLAAKINFAWSIGIEPETVKSHDPVTKKVFKEVVRAKDGRDRAELNARYTEFRKEYAGPGTKKSELRDSHREEIVKEINATVLGAVALKHS
ncbi:MAG: hypothetical protein JWL89_151 [Candidatus Saccharibacteria bacterium]|nr:hypothetical protein [Candidatus Saccharibacteria bacterium]